MPLIKTINLHKTYKTGTIYLEALKGIDIEINEGEFVAIMGPSGSGKSTLLQQLGLLDKPTKGKIIIDGKEVSEMSEDKKTKYRLNNMGFIFQDYELVPYLTALQNIILPLIASGINFKDAEKRAEEVLKKINLEDRKNHLPSELSGGQQQRISIARAIANKPRILFADEPCANLDSHSSHTVLSLFQKLNKEGQTIVMVTHEPEHKKYVNRIIYLKDGLIENQPEYQELL